MPDDDTTTLHLTPYEVTIFFQFRKHFDFFEGLVEAGVFEVRPSEVYLVVNSEGVLVRANVSKPWERRKKK